MNWCIWAGQGPFPLSVLVSPIPTPARVDLPALPCVLSFSLAMPSTITFILWLRARKILQAIK